MSWSLIQRSPIDCDASLCVSSNLKNEEAMAHVGPQHHHHHHHHPKKKKKFLVSYQLLINHCSYTSEI